jgi:hypothetical protein
MRNRHQRRSAVDGALHGFLKIFRIHAAKLSSRAIKSAFCKSARHVEPAALTV